MSSSFRILPISRLSRTSFLVPTWTIAVPRRYASSSLDAAPQRAADDMEDDEGREWAFDDISSIAHGELERHREARHYARIASYEMPRLARLAKPFTPPTKSQPLRFRYTTYFGEDHPAESKVVLEFSPLDIALEDVERNKLIKIVGSRYNPETRIVKMSCEMFEHQAQNKRYLSDTLDKLLKEAKDSEDTFEDIPFDFRHQKKKKKPPKFPQEWVGIAKQKAQQRAELAKQNAQQYIIGASPEITTL